MKLLIVGHSYVTAYAQKKYVAMKREFPSLQLKIVTPRVVKHMFKRYEREIAPELTAEEVVDLREFFFRSHMTYFLDPIAFVKLLRGYKPDYVHIEEDPHSLIGVETAALVSLCLPKTPMSFFIWDNLSRRPHFPLNFLKKLLTRFSLARATGVVAGNHEARHLLHIHKNYRGPCIVLPQLGVDYECYQNPPQSMGSFTPARTSEIPVIGYIGRLVHEKGILLLCKALDDLRALPWRLIVTGAGPLENDLQSIWKPRFGDRLTLQKAASYEEIPEQLKRLDLFVLPSYSTAMWKEQFGLILVEAMASGIAVIGSTCGAIPEVIGNAGILFKEGDIKSLGSALERLIASESERRRFSGLSRKRALDSFSHKVVSSAYMKVFEKFSLTPS